MALSILIDWFPYLFSGIVLTLGLVASALVIGVGIGLPMALGQVEDHWLSDSNLILCLVLQGTSGSCSFIPVLLWNFSGIETGLTCILCWCRCSGSMGRSIPVPGLPGAIQSISEGQMTAARSLACQGFRQSGLLSFRRP